MDYDRNPSIDQSPFKKTLSNPVAANRSHVEPESTSRLTALTAGPSASVTQDGMNDSHLTPQLNIFREDSAADFLDADIQMHFND